MCSAPNAAALAAAGSLADVWEYRVWAAPVSWPIASRARSGVGGGGGILLGIEVTLRQYGLGLDPARARSSHLRKPVLQGLGGSQGRGWSPVSTVRRAQNRVDQLDGSRELSQQLGLLSHQASADLLEMNYRVRLGIELRQERGRGRL